MLLELTSIFAYFREGPKEGSWIPNILLPMGILTCSAPSRIAMIQKLTLQYECCQKLINMFEKQHQEITRPYWIEKPQYKNVAG